MGLLINKSDFVGTYALSQSISDTITSFITEYEEKYLRELLGSSLFTLFKADIVSPAVIPATAKYLTIYNEINKDECGYLLHSDGIKKMLLGFIWFEYVTGTQITHTGTGVVTDVNEISVNADNSLTYKQYNRAIDTYRSIQQYIYLNSIDYPEFAGVNKRFASSF
jgi:hypothetical protein